MNRRAFLRLLPLLALPKIMADPPVETLNVIPFGFSHPIEITKMAEWSWAGLPYHHNNDGIGTWIGISREDSCQKLTKRSYAQSPTTQI